MPKRFIEDLGNSCHLGLWDIQETAAELLQLLDPGDEELEYLRKFRHQKRLKQSLAGRCLISDMMADYPDVSLVYDEFNRPDFTSDEMSLSLAHCGHMAVAIIGANHRFGVDVEWVQPKVELLKSKYLSEEELLQVGDEERELKLTVCWSAKESLYKYWGKKKLEFKEHLKLAPFDVDEGFLSGSITKDGELFEVSVVFRQVEDYVVSYIKTPLADHYQT